jgi:hypothetical protein
MYHFACPTSEVALLHNMIKQDNNQYLKLVLFIPRTRKVYVSNSLQVFNDVSDACMTSSSILKNIETANYRHQVIGIQKNTNDTNRNGKSLSIGLQTMYSHQQHTSRYSMLPHSRPHMTTVKDHPLPLRKSLLNAYQFICYMLESTDKWNDRHPFDCSDATIKLDDSWYTRLNLRQELVNRLLLEDTCMEKDKFPLNHMFESCTVQQTGSLRFHCDVMNCPSMDWTIALHVPNKMNKSVCMSYLYYSRKCVGDYTTRMGSIKSYLQSSNDSTRCKLTQLSLRSILELQGIFNYQGSLFEDEICLDTLGSRLEKDPTHSCPEVVRYTGLSCFKNGAAFDKMGYYSILSMSFYLYIIWE